VKRAQIKPSGDAHLPAALIDRADAGVGRIVDESYQERSDVDGRRAADVEHACRSAAVPADHDHGHVQDATALVVCPEAVELRTRLVRIADDQVLADGDRASVLSNGSAAAGHTQPQVAHDGQSAGKAAGREFDDVERATGV